MDDLVQQRYTPKIDFPLIVNGASSILGNGHMHIHHNQETKLEENIFKLSILDLRIWVHLGCSIEEKFHPQMVSFNIDLEFKSCPRGADTDLLEDTVCYFKLVEAVTEHCRTKKFNLIEHLTKFVYHQVADFISPYKHLIHSITVNLHKISPPVAGVHGGVKWTHHTRYK